MTDRTTLSFQVSGSQKAGDLLMFALLLPLFYGFWFLIGMLLFEGALFPERDAETLRWMEHLFAFALVVVLFRLVRLPWWWIECTDSHVVFKNIYRKKVPLEKIHLVHAGTRVEMQDDGRRSASVPLTIERSWAGDIRILLSPEDARACIEHLTARCDWIGGMNPDGEVILPRSEAASRRVKRTLGARFLLQGLVSLLFGLIAVAVVFSRGASVITMAANPIMAILGIIAILAIIGFGFWSMGKYRQLHQLKAGERSGESGTAADPVNPQPGDPSKE